MALPLAAAAADAAAAGVRGLVTAVGAVAVVGGLAAGAPLLPVRAAAVLLGGKWSAFTLGFAATVFGPILLALHEAGLLVARGLEAAAAAAAAADGDHHGFTGILPPPGLVLATRATLVGLFVAGFGARGNAGRAVAGFLAHRGRRHGEAADDAAVAIPPPPPPKRLSLAFLIESAIPFMAPWNVSVLSNVCYATNDELEDAHPHARQKLSLDLITKSGGARGRPILIYIHGGAWRVGDKNPIVPTCWHFAAKESWRLAPTATLYDMVVDVKRAIRWVRQNPDVHGGDVGFVALAGGSAGGHLATVAALTQNDPHFQPGFETVDTSVQALLALYPSLSPLTGPNLRRDYTTYFTGKIVQMTAAESRARTGRDTVADWADPTSLLASIPPALRTAGGRVPPTFIIQL
ncbi:hypothetical protein HK405_012099, partial [Cladochytrium tenue]